MENITASTFHDFANLAQLRGQANLDPNAATKEVAQQFESIFVGFMLKAMREATPEDSLFGSNNMRTYQQMFDNQLSLSMSSQGGIGLAPLIEKQISTAKALANSAG